jgi:hypothetical protein
MTKKSSSIIDLKNHQIQSREVKKYIHQNDHLNQGISSLDNFHIPLMGEEKMIHSVDNLDILEFNLPLDDERQEEEEIVVLESYIETIPLKIDFIPASAKKYNYDKYQFINPIKQLFTINPQTIYAARASMGVFISICLIMVMTIPSLRMANNGIRVKDNLLLQAAASENLLKSTNTENFNTLSTSLSEIANGLDKSSQDIASIQGNLNILLSILPGLSIIQNGSNLTSNVSEVITITSELSIAIEPFLSKEINPFDNNKQVTVVDGIKKIKELNQKLIPILGELNTNLSKLPITFVPGHRGDVLRQLNQDIPKLQQALIDSEPYIDIFLNFVGSDIVKKYVFIFQNNQEIRATGGFIGSFGMMNIDKGVVTKLDIKEIYNPDGQLAKNILAPEPLQELTTRWYLRDSNWFADFPTSARKIISFYEKTGGATPDGVISLTPTVIERLLLITGPITLDEYGVTINSDNFVKVTQYQTGVAYDKIENKPKQFIADLAPILINKLLSSDSSQYQKIIEALNNSFQEKHVLLYFLDPKLQDIVNKYNLGGQLYTAPKDYLSVIHTNIGGYKTDGVMQENLNIETRIEDNGKAINKVIVTREHKGGNTEFEWWNKDNINYMRTYIPKGSRILNVSGYTDKGEKTEIDGVAAYEQDSDLKAIKETLFHNEDWDIDIFEESDKSVIGGWVITRPGETSQVMVEYEIPFDFKSYDVYSLILQKQSGTLGIKYQYSLELPKHKKAIWKESSFDLEATETGFKVTDGALRTDEYIGVQIK